MGTPFKMKGSSLYKSSPMKQDKAKLTKQKTKKKVNLLKTAGTTTNPSKYFKLVDGKKVKISEATYNSLKGK